MQIAYRSWLAPLEQCNSFEVIVQFSLIFLHSVEKGEFGKTWRATHALGLSTSDGKLWKKMNPKQPARLSASLVNVSGLSDSPNTQKMTCKNSNMFNNYKYQELNMHLIIKS